MSTVVPAALTTVNVVDAWEIAAVPGVESKMLAVTVSEQEERVGGSENHEWLSLT